MNVPCVYHSGGRGVHFGICFDPGGLRTMGGRKIRGFFISIIMMTASYFDDMHMAGKIRSVIKNSY